MGGGGWIIHPRIISTRTARSRVEKMIRPASPGLEIFYLFHKEPVRGFILKYSTTPPPRRLNGAWPSINVGLHLGLFCEAQ